MPRCLNCGEDVPLNTQFCPYCGYTQFSSSGSIVVQYKRPGVAVILALILGVAGLMGVGHIYVGKVGKGIFLFIIGVVLGILTWGSFITGFLTFGLGFLASALFGFMLFAMWAWQIYDAYVLANLFNRRVQETGTAPW